MLAAGDTFRAAAIEQLKIWGGRVGAKVIAREQGSDAAGIAFDALTAAKAEGADVLLIDTAGRLQNRTELMSELEKIVRVMKKVEPTAPHAVLLVLDATVGQNAISQVEVFGKIAGVTGLVMTKLDGTARGGILVAIAEKFKLPIHFIGVGEGIDDLQPFTARDFCPRDRGAGDKRFHRGRIEQAARMQRRIKNELHVRQCRTEESPAQSVREARARFRAADPVLHRQWPAPGFSGPPAYLHGRGAWSLDRWSLMC